MNTEKSSIYLIPKYQTRSNKNINLQSQMLNWKIKKSQNNLNNIVKKQRERELLGLNYS